ncbi:MAG TPA: arginine--tRNA ligase [Candidatus Saccharimonadales bacterium]|nr:arginine--tRNA ligase [Candidatus Saccharimonadales bacterium]
MQEMNKALTSVVQDVFAADVTLEVTRPDEQFGDYATNVALQLARRLGKPPREIAEQLATALREQLGDRVQEVAIAGPGFINLRLSDGALAVQAAAAPHTKPQTYAGQVVVTEYSDPSAFKVLHAGHLYTSIVGDAIANVVAAMGGEVHRVNFGGDVGLHVGKTMWAIMQELGGEHPDKLAEIPDGEHADWMARCYVKGEQAYSDSEDAKAEIIDTNKRVYQVHATDDHDSPFAQIYWTCRKWSYDYFDAFYARIGSHFEKYYPESVTMPVGVETVQEQLEKGVYEKSDGAIVFRGEPYGLHTRVFINSQGLPTYEAKDVGLIMMKWADYHFDRSIIITDNAQMQYMEVVLKSIEQFAPELAQRTTHVTHGRVKLAGGVKMSSRKGNIVRAVDVLDAAADANKKAGHDSEVSSLGAVKYAFIKSRIGADIVYDPEESVSLEGNSGPYLQYAHARARSVLAKAGKTGGELADLDEHERSLARKISEYPEVLEKAVQELMPHHICTYLYELAQSFNRFYENAQVVGDPREATRLTLVALYADILKDGLGMLGIAAPDRM